jgi:alkylation response protein AidB-like acyl-CoA dehydrogenase
MDFDLSEDQLALRDAAADLISARCTTKRVREIGLTQKRLDVDLWRAMADQGWLAVERPEARGGLELGMVELAVLCEQIGRQLAPVPFIGTVLASGALEQAVSAGVADHREEIAGVSIGEWVDRLSTGAAVGALAWSGRRGAVAAEREGASPAGPAGDADGADGADRADGADGAWRLSGVTDAVVYAPAADVVVLFAYEPGPEGPSVSLFGVGQGASERPAAQPAMDQTRTLARLELVETKAARLGGAEQAELLLDRAATASCAEMLGQADRVLEMTVGYAKDRVQFGRPIGSFQAIKHRCADMLVDTEGMRSSAYYAAWAVGAGDADASSAASAAKVWCSDASSRVMASALQVHGGIGFTWEHDLHLFLKRAQLDQTSFGDAVFHRDRLARMLRPKAEAGLPIL